VIVDEVTAIDSHSIGSLVRDVRILMVIKHILSYLFFAVSPSTCVACSGNSLFPERLGDIQLIRLIAGERARAEVNGLRGRSDIQKFSPNQSHDTQLHVL
jgi:hypothetical protein